MMESSIPKESECISVDNKLHVQLFQNGCPIPLPQWFTVGQSYTLKSVTQLENFPTHIRFVSENFSSIADEFREICFKKKPIYSACLIRYTLLLVRHTSLQHIRCC